MFFRVTNDSEAQYRICSIMPIYDILKRLVTMPSRLQATHVDIYGGSGDEDSSEEEEEDEDEFEEEVRRTHS